MKRNKKLIIGITIVLTLMGVLSLSYAYLSIGDKQEKENTFKSGCLSIIITEESEAIKLSNVMPVTDVEGLDNEGYTFTIKNTCTTSNNYIINVENINKQENSLSSDNLKVAINGDSFDNIISILSSNKKTEPSIDGAYEAYTIYSGRIEGEETKSFKVREWLDYDATANSAANKSITNKINVIATTDIEIEETPEIKFAIGENSLVGTINNGSNNVKYCITKEDACNPYEELNIEENKVTIKKEQEVKTKKVATALGEIKINQESKNIICSKVDNGKTICSEVYITGKPDFNKSPQKTCEGIEVPCEETNGIYESVDDDGATYYYRGSVENNYVKFAGLWWRIIRVNGDGSIRLIYDGTEAHSNEAKTNDSIAVENVPFNRSRNDNAYVGFKYTVGQLRGTSEKSNALIELETWYKDHLLSYANKIDLNAGFCGDRTPSTDDHITNGLGGTGTTTTYYGSVRMFYGIYPELKCPNSLDLYTQKLAKKGNKSLDYPVGLITVDEAAMAGAVGKNLSYYLYNGYSFWTISPSRYSGNNENACYVMYITQNESRISNSWISSSANIRPVINLSADTKFTFAGVGEKGSMTNPYIVS